MQEKSQFGSTKLPKTPPIHEKQVLFPRILAVSYGCKKLPSGRINLVFQNVKFL